MLWLMLSLAAAAASQPVGGPYDDRPLSREYHRCVRADSSTAGTGQCLETEVQWQEGRLNQAYRMVMARLPAARKAALLISERAWVTARKRECDRVYREMEGGTGDGIAIDTCLAVRAAERTAWLERFR
jgi:uncharacterized protein YecT (DUF1311 family)